MIIPKPGDRVRLPPVRVSSKVQTAKPAEFPIVYEDAALLVVDKPSGKGALPVVHGKIYGMLPPQFVSSDEKLVKPADPNLLTAKLEANPASGAKVVFSAKLSDGDELQARFVTK